MKKLHKLLIGAYVGPLLVTSLIVLFILSMQFLWKYVDELMGKGLSWHVLARLLFYASMSFVPLAIPLGVLLSSIMTIGAFGENSELPPMRSAGLGLFRILLPLIVFVVLLSGGSFYFSNNLLPMANLKFRSLLYDATRTKPALELRPGVFYNGIEGLSIRVREKNDDTGELGDVLIYDHRDQQRNTVSVVRAERGTMQRSTDQRYLVLTLFNGTVYDESPATEKASAASRPLLRGTFEKTALRLDLSGFGFEPTDEDLFKDHYQMLTMGQLQYAEDSLMANYERRVRDQGGNLGNSLSILRESTPARPRSPRAAPQARPPRRAAEVHELAMNRVRGMINQLDGIIEERKGRMEELAKFRVEWHRKLTLSIACLLMFFIGAPLGAIIRKGGMGLPTVFAIVFFLIFHIISYSTERLCKANELSPWPGMWISTAVLLPIGLWLTWTAATDSPLLDRDAYYRALDRLRSRWRRRDAHPPIVQ